jgi:hypothetical protein
LRSLEQYNEGAALTEINDESVLHSFRKYVPNLRMGNAAIFRWIAIGTLVFELIYFWPHS